jgi:hypothetical protein
MNLALCFIFDFRIADRYRKAALIPKIILASMFNTGKTGMHVRRCILSEQGGFVKIAKILVMAHGSMRGLVDQAGNAQYPALHLRHGALGWRQAGLEKASMRPLTVAR